MDVPRRTVLIVGVGVLVTTSATFAALTDENTTLRDQVERPAPEPVAIPAEAIWLRPDGVDTNPGTAAKPKRTPVPGRFNAFQSGTWENLLYFDSTPDTTLAAAPDAVVVWDGKDATPNAILAGGDRLTIHGIEFRGYEPTVEETDGTGYESALYLTGNGQVLTDVQVTGCGMTGIKIVGDDVKVIRTVLSNIGKTGINADTAARLLIDRAHIVAFNQRAGNRSDDTAAIKITRSDDVRILAPFVRDGAGVPGVWFDTACPRALVRAPDIDGVGVDGRAKMGMGVFIEGADGGKFDGVQNYSYVLGGTITGCTAGVKYLDSGWIVTWGVDLRGNDIGIYMQQDWRYNTGTKPLELTADQSPWLTRGHVVANNLVDGPYAVIAYADGAGHAMPSQCLIKGGDMFDRFSGNWVNGAVELGTIPVGSRVSFRTQAALDDAPAAVGGPLGSRFTENYFGTDPTAAVKVRVAAPAAVAALLP